MLEQLMRLPVNVVSIEELLAAQIFGKQLEARFKELQYVQAPAWLTEKLRQIQVAIETKVEDAKALRIHVLEREALGLMPKEERRQEVLRELRQLKGEPEPEAATK